MEEGHFTLRWSPTTLSWTIGKGNGRRLRLGKGPLRKEPRDLRRGCSPARQKEASKKAELAGSGGGGNRPADVARGFRGRSPKEEPPLLRTCRSSPPIW